MAPVKEMNTAAPTATEAPFQEMKSHLLCATDVTALDEDDYINLSLHSGVNLTTDDGINAETDDVINVAASAEEFETALSKPLDGTHSPRRNQTVPDELSISLSRSRPPIQICTNESINVKYKVNYKRELGRGTNTIIYESIERSTRKKYAVKTVDRIDKEEYEHMRKEIDLLSNMTHSSIINLQAAYEDGNRLYMIIEQCHGGDLHDYVMDRTKSKINKKTGQEVVIRANINEATAAAIVRKVVDAVAYLHEHDVVHRDLKLENILFLSKHKPSAKADATMDTDIRLIDFGLSKRYDTHKKPASLVKLKSFVGTNFYVAPEILQPESDRGYTHTCDIWSVGVLAYALLSAKPPFVGSTDREIFSSIKKCEFDFPSPAWDAVSDEAKDLIRQCLVKDESLRPSAVELRSHPWIVDALRNDKGVRRRRRISIGGVGFLKKVFRRGSMKE